MPHPVDLAARVFADVAPRRWTPRIDQARMDARAILLRLGGRELDPLVTQDDRNTPPRLEEVALLDVLPRGIATRVRGVGRDLTMVARQLRGRRPTPFVRRRPNNTSVPTPSAPTVASRDRVTVTDRIEETPRAVTLVLDGPIFEDLPPRAGQFLTVEAMIEGRRVRRCYSFSSSEGAPPAITIKRVDDGTMSTYLTQAISAGDTLKVLPAGGRFTLDAIRGDRGDGRLLFIAGGSGITPVISLIETALQRGQPYVHLVYGNRSAEDTIFATRLAQLAARYADRFTITWFTETDAPASHRSGLPNEAALTRELEALSVDTGEVAFVCGPKPMMDAAERALATVGVKDVRVERFAIAEPSREIAKSALVTFDLGEREVTAASSGQTLLEVAEDAGVELPFSCAMGGCGTCRLKVDGDVVMDEPNALTNEERRDGYVLTCVSRACGPVRVKL